MNYYVRYYVTEGATAYVNASLKATELSEARVEAYLRFLPKTAGGRIEIYNRFPVGQDFQPLCVIRRISASDVAVDELEPNT